MEDEEVVIVDSDSESDQEDVPPQAQWSAPLKHLGFAKERIAEAVQKFDSFSSALSWLSDTADSWKSVSIDAGVPVVQVNDQEYASASPYSSVSYTAGGGAMAASASGTYPHSDMLPFPPSLSGYFHKTGFAEHCMSVLSQDNTSAVQRALLGKPPGTPASASFSKSGVTASCGATSASSNSLLMGRKVAAVDLTATLPLSTGKRPLHVRKTTTPRSLGLTAPLSKSARDRRRAQLQAELSKAPAKSVTCQACSCATASTDTCRLAFCKHNVCVGCLRHAVALAGKLTEAETPLRTGGKESSPLSREPDAMPLLSTKLVASRSSSPRKAKATSSAASLVAEQPAVKVPLVNADADASRLFPPMVCPVKGCDTPISWHCLEDLMGSTRWHQFINRCLKSFDEMALARPHLGGSVSLKCPECKSGLWADAEDFKVDSGYYVSCLSATEMKKWLQDENLQRSGSRSVLQQRIQDVVKSKAVRSGEVAPPMLRCFNSHCELHMCWLCGNTEIPASSTPVKTRRAAPAKSSATGCKSHATCPSRVMFATISLCAALAAVQRDSGSSPSKKKRKVASKPDVVPKKYSAEANGIGYSGGHNELAGGSSSALAREARQREEACDKQSREMLTTLNNLLDTMANGIGSYIPEIKKPGKVSTDDCIAIDDDCSADAGSEQLVLPFVKHRRTSPSLQLTPVPPMSISGLSTTTGL